MVPSFVLNGIEILKRIPALTRKGIIPSGNKKYVCLGFRLAVPSIPVDTVTEKQSFLPVHFVDYLISWQGGIRDSIRTLPPPEFRWVCRL